MKRWLIVFALALPFHLALGQNQSPVGYWQTTDDNDQPESIVHIQKINGMLEGTIVKYFPKSDETSNPLCKKCPGSLKSQPIKGLRFVWGMKPAGNLKWSGGKILDPKNGKTYHCKMSLSRSGNNLSVRGYIGISLFGRTQTWLRD